ncbi:hypothetical protein Tco_0443539 [Tanacetum coccineum]
MSTSKTYQQSLADAGYETRPPMLERGSYILWAIPKLQTAEDLQGDALLHYDAEMELIYLILLSIPNDIYNSQFEKLVNISRAKKLEKSHDPLALVAHTVERNHYARYCPKLEFVLLGTPKYFHGYKWCSRYNWMMIGVILYRYESIDFLFADASKDGRNKELSYKRYA